MRERTRFEGEVEDLFVAPREAEVPGGPPAWPPKGLKTSVIFRHWRSAGGGPVILTAADLDPGFADNAQTKSCLDAWRKSTAPSALHSHVALVDLSHTGARYTGIRDNESVDLASSSKSGIMYPAFQLRRDVRVLAERDKPATTAALFVAMRDKWASDLVDGGHFGNRAAARGWVSSNAPVLERTIAYSPGTPVSPGSHPVSFAPDFETAISEMVVRSSNDGRTTCIGLMKHTYINSVFSQSGAVSGFKPITWTGTARAVAAMMSLIARRRLVTADDSAEMWRLMNTGATTGAGSWTRYALEGRDDDSNATLKRAYQDVAGKIGYLYGGPRDTWWDNITTMADAVIVSKGPSKSYVLVFTIPFFKRVIHKKDIFPLIRAAHDCV
jgi:hypothetical protein